jgi:hypothetical protein
MNRATRSARACCPRIHQSLRDAATTAGQLSAAIAAEVKRGELMRFYVKQVESAHVNEFSRMGDEELQAFIRRAL